jgi:hypothetical protein
VKKPWFYLIRGIKKKNHLTTASTMTTLLSRSLHRLHTSIGFSKCKQRANVRVAGQANVRLTPSAREEYEYLFVNYTQKSDQ